jgi:chorismate mutase
MKNNISIFQPARWDEIIKTRIKEGREKQLSEEFITKLYQFIHEESIRLQEQVLND